MENQKKDSKTWGDRQKIELVCRPMDQKKKKKFSMSAEAL